ncbi:MAG: peptidoglycan DD-metalloendopeptidase family protein [Chloroflexia bacterium]|nr:peptidoglycan DD-metalloendopeptidase family protein [Chloroflexia bacterium]
MQRLPAHLVLLLVLGLMLFFSGFRGALAQPITANTSGKDPSWHILRVPDEIAATANAYDSIPPMPVIISQPRQVLPPPMPVEQEQDLNSEIPLHGEVITYVVQEGDTLGSIAARFDLSVETLYWFNDLESAEVLSIDQELLVPPVDGLLHKVEEEETLDSIAEDYGVRKGNMIAYKPNDLREPYTLQVEQEIFVPGAAKPIPQPAVTHKGTPSYISSSNTPPYAALPGGERFSWPAWGRITDHFGWTGTRWHTGLDIAAPWSTALYSSAAGTVSYAGWRGNMGYMVEIDHGEGWVTRYGHMCQFPEVGTGQWVERGQLIGFMGCTGYCTGSHVHFEIRYEGNYVDPLSYLQ